VKKGWIKAGRSLTAAPVTELSAKIEQVQKALNKVLKPGRRVVSAIRYANGKLEEIIEQPFEDTGELGKPTAPPAGGAYRSPSEPEHARAARADDKPPEKPAEEGKAVSVAAPKKGCPAPDFDPYELKARQVLEVFLDPTQIADFRQHNAFITVGGMTGDRYMITSRHARERLARGYGRSLYNLDKKQVVCTHDWSVPPAEEMLALHVLASLPAWEHYLLELPDNGEQPDQIDDQITAEEHATVRGFVCRNEDVEEYDGQPR
jgi:hypothetical protein